MRVFLLCAAAALLAAGCTNPPATAPDSHAETKGESKRAAPPPEPKPDTAPSGKATAPWGTVSGRVTWDGDDLPDLPPLKVSADVAHCSSKGPIPDEKWVINKDNKGVKNVFVWLEPTDPKAKLPVHPSLEEPRRKEVVVDQPCCKFEPRALALREGQVLVVRNSSPVLHNFNYVGGDDNPGDNPSIAAGKEHRISNLKASARPIAVSCGIHGWMKGWVRIFDHPYFAITDADGKFEIKDAPAGKYNLVMWHEEQGWAHGGKHGKPVEVKAGGVTEVSERAHLAE